MSDEKKQSPRVRRVGEKDRKTQIDTGGPLFPPDSPPPPSDAPPPTLPEDFSEPDDAEALVDDITTAEEIDPVELAAQASATSALDEDAASLLAELETQIDEGTEEDEEDFYPIVPEEHARYRRPYAAPQRDRFPPLPDEEEAGYARLKSPPRVQPSPAPKRGNAKYNIFTCGVVLATFGLIGIFAFLWQNPYSELNPFAPFTPPPVIVTQTYTPSLTFTPSETPIPSPTPTPVPPTATLTPEATEAPQVPIPETIEQTRFALQGGRTIFITNPDGRGGCRWSSIAGTVADANGQALNGYQIRVLGDGVDDTIISGTAPGYGPGGFELQVGNEAEDAEYAVQLLDPEGTPVSDVITAATSSRCDWNISVLRFVQNPQS